MSREAHRRTTEIVQIVRYSDDHYVVEHLGKLRKIGPPFSCHLAGFAAGRQNQCLAGDARSSGGAGGGAGGRAGGASQGATIKVPRALSLASTEPGVLVVFEACD